MSHLKESPVPDKHKKITIKNNENGVLVFNINNNFQIQRSL